MYHKNIMLTIILSLGAASVSFAGGRNEPNRCQAPAYKIALTYVEEPGSKAIAISIKPRDVTVQNLYALACQLRADYESERELFVDIFNDESAARHTTVPTKIAVENSPKSNPAAYLATYHLDRLKNLDILTLVVNPKDPCGRDIQVDLARNEASIVSCK